MKLLLLNPGHPGIAVDRPSLGLPYIASSVTEACGTEVRIIDLTVEHLTSDQVVDTVRDFGPQVIGFSVLSCTYEVSANLARAIRKAYPMALHVAGGPHPSASPLDVLRGAEFDLAVQGEGEYTMIDIIRACENSPDTPVVKGTYAKSRDGRSVSGGVRLPIADLDRLPFPARNLLPLHRYDYTIDGRKATQICSSRGCPMKCIFCDQSVFGEDFRARSAEGVLVEIAHIVEGSGYGAFDFIDDTFTLDGKRVQSICSGILERGHDVLWRCLGRVDNVNPGLLEDMRAAGCVQIYYGIESGSERSLRLIGKKFTVPQVRQAIRWTKEAGIRAKGFFMLGLPWETREDIQRTISLAEELGLDGGKFAMPKPLPNTRLLAQLRASGKLLSETTSQLAYYLSDHDQIFKYDHLEHGEVLGLLKEAKERLGKDWHG